MSKFDSKKVMPRYFVCPTYVKVYVVNSYNKIVVFIGIFSL